MKNILCIAILAMIMQGCIITAPCTVAWRSNVTQQTADTEGRNKRGTDTNTVNAEKQTDISANVPTSKTSKTSTKSVAEKAVEKAAEKPADDDDCPECRN